MLLEAEYVSLLPIIRRIAGIYPLRYRDDMAQEAALRIWEHRNAAPSEGKNRWVAFLSMNECIRYLQRETGQELKRVDVLAKAAVVPDMEGRIYAVESAERKTFAGGKPIVWKL